MADRKQKKKRQHYVPRLLLRRFSPDERTIATFVLGSGKVVPAASLRDQCAADYFYGEDQVVENAFQEHEGAFADIIRDLDPAALSALDESALMDIKLFVHFQRWRTLAASQDVNDVWDDLGRRILAKDSTLADIDLSLFRIQLTNPQGIALSQAAITSPLVYDLGVKFLVTDKRVGFVISDHPVVACNQYVEHHPAYRSHRGITGLAVRGLLLFLPLSPSVTVLLYDTTTYDAGHGLVGGIGIRDTRLLNRLQAVNAASCIYFAPDRTASDELARLKAERGGSKLTRPREVFESPTFESDGGKAGTFMLVSSGDTRLGSRFGFIKENPAPPAPVLYGGGLPLRSPELLELVQVNRNEFDRLQEESERSAGGGA